MSPIRREAGTAAPRLPRVSGDEPFGATPEDRARLFSPHEWG